MGARCCIEEDELQNTGKANSNPNQNATTEENAGNNGFMEKILMEERGKEPFRR